MENLYNPQMQLAPTNFIDYFRFEPELLCRISGLLWTQLYNLKYSHNFNELAVIDCIKNIENSKTGFGGIKQPTQYYQDKSPLKGLWHHHIFSSFDGTHILKNMFPDYKSKSKKSIKSFANDLLSQGRFQTEDETAKSYGIKIKEVERRGTEGKLTGEWLIYSVHNGQNYYLTVGSHEEGDVLIYDRILNQCYVEFPFLK